MQDGSPRLGMQALLEEIESRSRHISQVFSGADPRWREIVGYGKGHVAQGRRMRAVTPLVSRSLGRPWAAVSYALATKIDLLNLP